MTEPTISVHFKSGCGLCGKRFKHTHLWSEWKKFTGKVSA